MKLTWRNTLTMMMVTCLVFTLYACSNNSSGNKGDIADQAGSEPANGTNASTAKAAASAENPSDLTGEMTMWGWDNEHFKVYMAAFNKAYPNVKVNYVPVESSEYANKVRVGLSTNTEFPDVVTIEESFIPQFINLGVFEDLSAAPYNMDTSKFPGFLVDRYTDDTGYLGPPDSTSPAAMYYRRDLAKKYLGTDDPEEVGKLIGAGEAGWDKFLAVGEKLKADSNGEVFLIPGLGDMINVLKKQPKSDWRDGNTLTVKENYLPHFQMLKDIRDKGLDAKTEQWSAAWNATYANGNVLFFPGASWYVGFVVGLNDKDGNGRWGITGTPLC
jgi:multiple sugar transport system substrate-binding protein